MDQILQSLNLNGTIFYQFIIGVTFFITAKFVLFNKVKEIVLLREDKTVNLDKKADEEMTRAAQLANQYEESLKDTQKNAQEIFKTKSEEADKESGKIISNAEQEANSFIKEKRDEYLKEVSGKRSEVMALADNLSGELVKKLTQ